MSPPARRRATPRDTRKHAPGGDFEARSVSLLLFSFAVRQKTPMASLHATQVWFGGMNIKKNNISDSNTTARAGMPARAAEMENVNFSKKMLGSGFEPRT